MDETEFFKSLMKSMQGTHAQEITSDSRTCLHLAEIEIIYKGQIVNSKV